MQLPRDKPNPSATDRSLARGSPTLYGALPFMATVAVQVSSMIQLQSTPAVAAPIIAQSAEPIEHVRFQPPEKVYYGSMLGQGTFGNVHHGQYRGQVAAFKISRSNSSRGHLAQKTAILSLPLKHLQPEYVVSFIAAGTFSDGISSWLALEMLDTRLRHLPSVTKRQKESVLRGLNASTMPVFCTAISQRGILHTNVAQ